MFARWGWLALFLPAVGAFGIGETYAPLFVIERDFNHNVVHYDAKVKPDGSLDSADPVVVYWIMGEKNGRRQDLNILERTKAYGFRATAGPVGGSVQITLVSDGAHPMLIRPTPQGIRAETNISGRRSYLRRILVKTRKTMLLEIPQSAELFGEDIETGEQRSELVPAKL
jgi:hypothetical protein